MIMHGHHIFYNIIVILIVLYWICYSVAVVIYLNYLTRKYLISINRDEIIGSKVLKSYQSLLDKYTDANSINILVLTGGGIRGAIPIHILTEIERITGKKTGELFDFVSGTSTGAITVATLIANDGKDGFKYSASEIKQNYLAQSRKIFSSPWYHQYLTFFGLFAPRFLPNNKLQILEEFFGNTTISELMGNLLIPVYNIDQNNLQIVKNWNPPYGQPNENYLTTDLINGASNPPMIFSPVAFSIKDKDHLLIDPAVILNNPILHVLFCVRSLLPEKHINLVFIGNGSGGNSEKYDYRSMFGFGLYGLYQYLFSAPTLSSRLYSDFMKDYLFDTQRFDRKISYFPIISIPRESMSPTSMSQTNFDKITKFAELLYEENKDKIIELSAALIKGRKY